MLFRYLNYVHAFVQNVWRNVGYLHGPSQRFASFSIVVQTRLNFPCSFYSVAFVLIVWQHFNLFWISVSFQTFLVTWYSKAFETLFVCTSLSCALIKKMPFKAALWNGSKYDVTYGCLWTFKPNAWIKSYVTLKIHVWNHRKHIKIYTDDVTSNVRLERRILKTSV